MTQWKKWRRGPSSSAPLRQRRAFHPRSRRRDEHQLAKTTPTMAQAFPYTFYSCPCVDTSTPSSRVRDKRSSQYSIHANEEDERTFDPRNPRSNYSLYPLEHLLYCEDCHQIRCPRCVSEEVITWFCPSCLFEVPSSNVRSDGNRCVWVGHLDLFQ